jgi:hypothetical protein
MLALRRGIGSVRRPRAIRARSWECPHRTIRGLARGTAVTQGVEWRTSTRPTALGEGDGPPHACAIGVRSSVLFAISVSLALIRRRGKELPHGDCVVLVAGLAASSLSRGGGGSPSPRPRWKAASSPAPRGPRAWKRKRTRSRTPPTTGSARHPLRRPDHAARARERHAWVATIVCSAMCRQSRLRPPSSRPP